MIWHIIAGMCVTVVVLLLVYGFSRNVMPDEVRQDQARAKAISRGNVVVAKRMHQHRHAAKPDHPCRYQYGLYQYYVDGVEYYTRLRKEGELQDQETLYYLDDPKKANLEGQIRLNWRPWWTSGCMIFLVITMAFQNAC